MCIKVDGSRATITVNDPGVPTATISCSTIGMVTCFPPHAATLGQFVLVITLPVNADGGGDEEMLSITFVSDIATRNGLYYHITTACLDAVAFADGTATQPPDYNATRNSSNSRGSSSSGGHSNDSTAAARGSSSDGSNSLATIFRASQIQDSHNTQYTTPTCGGDRKISRAGSSSPQDTVPCAFPPAPMHTSTTPEGTTEVCARTRWLDASTTPEGTTEVCARTRWLHAFF